MKKFLIFIIILVAIAAGLCGWAIYKNHDPDKFSKNTYINGIDCSGRTVDAAATRLSEKWNRTPLTIRRDGRTIDRINYFDFEYDIKDQLEDLKGSDYIGSVLSYYGLRKNEYEIDMNIVKQTPYFKEKVNSIDFPVDGKIKRTKDAYLDLTNYKYDIVPEVYGNIPQKGKIRKAIVASIENGDFKFEFNGKDYCKKPKILSDNEKLLKKQEYWRKYMSARVVLDLGYREMMVDPFELKNIIKVNDGVRTVSKKGVRAFVDSIAQGAEERFNVYKGTYGRSLNRGRCVRDMMKLYTADKSGTVKVHYGKSNSPVFRGGTYVDIDISAQYLRVYVKGKLKVKTPVVTGNHDNGQDTPLGTYHVFNKMSPAVLKGFNNDGTRYASPVSFWMPFNGGVGMHDAPWKSVYGGTEYLHNGSHGCVNMPYKAAKTTYGIVEIGTTVIVHQ